MFNNAPIDAISWARILIGAVIVFFVVEVPALPTDTTAFDGLG